MKYKVGDVIAFNVYIPQDEYVVITKIIEDKYYFQCIDFDEPPNLSWDYSSFVDMYSELITDLFSEDYET